jgi:hypothetical protein
MTRFRSVPRRSAAVVAVFAVLLAGCGRPAAVVSGTVTVDGDPASDGSVNFEPVDGQGPSAGAKITDGKFTVPEEVAMTPGKKRATVRASVKTGKMVQAAPPPPPGLMTDELRFYPAPGVKPDVREVELKEGENELSFDLTTKATDKKAGAASDYLLKPGEKKK